MPRLAFYTFAVGKGPKRSETVAGFEAMLGPVFKHAQQADGFIDRFTKPDDRSPFFGQDFGPWGTYAVPRFYTDGTEWGTATQAITLSLWRDPESVRKFAYEGMHARMLAQRERWFVEPKWPSYVMWWVGDSEYPTWTDGAARLEHLHDYGPTPYAFNFHVPFNAAGERLTVPELSPRVSGGDTFTQA